MGTTQRKEQKKNEIGKGNHHFNKTASEHG